jgi:hypothetical protein
MSETNEQRAYALLDAIGWPEGSASTSLHFVEEALAAAEARGIALGRAAERRDVVAWFRTRKIPRFAGYVGRIVENALRLIESGAHLPAKETPDADE